ncbi:MAG TPA: hypothetical protein VKD22_11715 [Ramlibacter sp.]|nr:hypothetical protein [Ramlibacter sp.]
MRVALVLACLLAATVAVAQPVIERATKGTQCVADPSFMRRNHMDLLKHQRVLTVHDGMRNGKFSLKACVSCHASRETGSVAAGPNDFCVSCHSYAAVKIDCFECHSSRPGGSQLAARAATGAAK